MTKQNCLRLVAPLLPILTISVLTLLVLRTAVHNWPSVWSALQALWQGAFGTPYDIGNTMNKTTPLILTGLGVAIAFRGRMWNIGGEGQFLIGAIAASAIWALRVNVNNPSAYWWPMSLQIAEVTIALLKYIRQLPSPILISVLLMASLVAGALWGGIAGRMRTKRNVPEVIGTIMLNFIAIEMLSYLVHGPMQEAGGGQPASEPLPDRAMLPILVPHTTLHAGLVIALTAVVVVSIFLFRTRAGYAVRVVGANPEAARTAGIDVDRTLLVAMLWSGGLCGLAGGVELSGVLGTLNEDYLPGYGFTAIAVALLGRLHPVGIVFAALFFGALTAGCGSMERMAGVSFALSYVIQAMTLLVLLAWQRVKPSARE